MISATKHQLTSAEMALLWTDYMFESLVHQVSRTFQVHVEDADTKEIYDVSDQYSQEHLEICDTAHFRILHRRDAG